MKGGEHTLLITEKIKIRPNKELRRRLHHLVDGKRFIYNYMVNLVNHDKISSISARNTYRKLLKENKVLNKDGDVIDPKFHDLLSSIPSQIEDICVDDIKRALKSKRKKKLLEYKSKRNSRRSFTIHRKNDSNFKFNDGLLKVVKMDTPIKLYMNKFKHYTGKEQIKRITISNNTYGWYISISYELDYNPYKMKKTNKKIGIDWGIKSFATDSSGKIFTFKKRKKLVNYEEYERLYNKLKHLQKIQSKKRLNNDTWYLSRKYESLKTKITHIYEKLANIRRNFLHYVSKYYIKNYDHIAIEDLKPSNMNKNHKLARMINEAMFYTWKVFLSYKSELYDKVLLIVNPRDTSQTCSQCGTVLKGKNKLKLSNRIFKCNSCNLKINRDHNAAINILNLSLA